LEQAIERNRIDKCHIDVFGTIGQLDKEIAVKKISMSNKNNKVRFLRGIVLGIIALAVLAGLGTAGYAATSGSSSQTLEPDQISIFDPFLLSSTIVSVKESSVSSSVYSGSIKLSDLPVIQIPSRPALRSPFRPPFSLDVS
jgi:hypothetical protein